MRRDLKYLFWGVELMKIITRPLKPGGWYYKNKTKLTIYVPCYYKRPIKPGKIVLNVIPTPIKSVAWYYFCLFLTCNINRFLQHRSVLATSIGSCRTSLFSLGSTRFNSSTPKKEKSCEASLALVPLLLVSSQIRKAPAGPARNNSTFSI